EAVARTKIVLKLLEAKAEAAAQPPSHGGDGGGRRSSGAVMATASSSSSSGAKFKSSAARDRGPSSSPKDISNPDEGGTKRSIHKVLRIATEAYSDRVGQQGGGVTRYRPPTSGAAGTGAGAGGAGLAGTRAVRGDRARMNASALSVQVAFRRRMFHRFVWAQAYLRRPTHAYGILKRVCPPRLGGGGAGVSAGAGAGVGPAGTAGAMATTPIESVMVIDAWPELQGFCLSVPHHVHAADTAYLEYYRATSPAHATAAVTTITAAATATAATTAATTSQLPNISSSPVRFITDASPPPPSPLLPPPPPPGAQLFERKHPIHAAAVRSVLLDLRVPFGPGALDAAMEDLERVISGGDGGASGGKPHSRGGSKSQAQQSSSDRDSHRKSQAQSSSDRHGRRSGVARGGRSPNGPRLGGYGHHGGGLSFVGWHDWWVRHLPYDPASTDCLLKTVRCAKGLHSAEMA
ncbi:unnamed protein product, partial [Laminaria digitata]